MENKKVILVTGASSGIGLLIATLLHGKGYKVFGTSRYPEKYKNKVPFELLPLDITSGESIRNSLDTLFSKTKNLDVLINNAGYALGGSVEETGIEKAYEQFETNFWGAVKMTKAVLPFMREQRSGKIITIGSLAGLIGMPFESYYSASKHALEGFFKSLRFELKDFNIKVSVVEPEFFKTNIGQASEFVEPSINDYDKMRKSMTDFFTNSIANAPSPEPVAETVLKIIESTNPKYSYRVGRNAKLLPVLQFFSNKLFENGFAKTAKM
jgi:short-subunit dehydrogenase